MGGSLVFIGGGLGLRLSAPGAVLVIALGAPPGPRPLPGVPAHTTADPQSLVPLQAGFHLGKPRRRRGETVLASGGHAVVGVEVTGLALNAGVIFAAELRVQLSYGGAPRVLWAMSAPSFVRAVWCRTGLAPGVCRTWDTAGPILLELWGQTLPE